LSAAHLVNKRGFEGSSETVEQLRFDRHGGKATAARCLNPELIGLPARHMTLRNMPLSWDECGVLHPLHGLLRALFPGFAQHVGYGASGTFLSAAIFEFYYEWTASPTSKSPKQWIVQGLHLLADGAREAA